MAWFLVVALSAMYAEMRLRWGIERQRRIEAERERDGYHRVAVDVVGRLGRFCDARPSAPPVERVA